MIKAKASRVGLGKISTDDRTDHQFGQIFGYWITNKKTETPKLNCERSELKMAELRFGLIESNAAAKPTKTDRDR